MSTTEPRTTGLVTPRYIVMSVLNRLGQYDMKSYKRLLQICLEGFMELNLWHLGAGSDVVYLHMSLAKTVDLPSDYVDWLRIGFPVNGKLRAITNNDNILLPRVFDDTQEPVGNTTTTENTNALSNAIFFSDHWRGGQYIGGLFGLPGGIDRAYFRFDMNKSPRQIVFSGTTPRSEIILEYQTTGLRTDGTSLIPREAVPALRTYVEWQMIAMDMTGFMTGRAQQKAAMGEIARRKQEHEEAVAMLRSFQNSFTKEEYLHAVYSTYRQTPKR
jgi:hypothetical protein